MTDNIVRAIRAVVNLGNYSFDAYEMPDGEKRVGFAGVSTLLGYEKDWLGRLADRGKKQLKAIQDMGYSGAAKEVEIFTKGVNATRANTITIRDFTKIIGYESLVKKNERAIIISLAMMEFGLEQTINLAFAGKSTDRILSKIKHYTTWTHDELMQAFADNREDANNLRLGNIR